MVFRSKSLPPMSSLIPFEAAARNLSFSRAAEEIFVTQAAVSKQVRLLEAYFGQKLFVRKGRNIEITANGKALYQAISQGLTQIAEASDQISHKRCPDRISIAMRLPFASQFMAARMIRFRDEFDNIDVSIVTTERNPLLLLDTVDMSVVLGFEPQPGLTADYLHSEEIFPVCSPGYVAQHPEFKTEQDIPDQTLLHLSAEHWRDLAWKPLDWPVLACALGTSREITADGLTFNNYELLMSAAVSGIGVAIAWHHLSKEVLEQGHLVRPIVGSYRIDRKHYLVTHEERSEDALIKRLRKWFIRETACFRDGSIEN